MFCGDKLSDRVSSEKLLAVSAAGPPAAFFQKLTCLDFSNMSLFGKGLILLRFGQKIHPDTQGDSQEALRRLSGGSLEVLRRLSETICASEALDQSWKAFHVEIIMFFCRK